MALYNMYEGLAVQHLRTLLPVGIKDALSKPFKGL